MIMLVLLSEINLAECRALRDSKTKKSKHHSDGEEGVGGSGRRLVGVTASFSKASTHRTIKGRVAAEDDHFYTMASGPSRKGSGH